MTVDSFLKDTRRLEDGQIWRNVTWDAVPQREQIHLALKSGDVGRYVLLPGDPDRCAPIAKYFDNAVKVAQKREYTTYTGTLLGEVVSVTSTGIGCPSASIAVEELSAIGADTFIRVGTSAAIQPTCLRGDLVVASAAVRDDGTSRSYVPIEFPAVADIDITIALRDAARSLGMRYQVGFVATKDAFYGQRAYYRLPTEERLRYRWQAWLRAGVLCTEMEAAAIYVVSSLLGKRAGGVMLVATNQAVEDELTEASVPRQPIPKDNVIHTAVEALKLLIERDRASGR
jgi:uridine phosphorylase